MVAMADSAYAEAGVDTSRADTAVAALVSVLRTIDTGRPSRAVLGSGHYANVLRIDDRTGIALSTDGVGSKIIVAEEMGKYDTVGIDCIAMNVNDVICVGAEPLAVLDYIAVEDADPEMLRAIAVGLRAGAAELQEVFNMGCGFCVVVPADQADAAVEIAAERHQGTAVIGQVTSEA